MGFKHSPTAGLTFPRRANLLVVYSKFFVRAGSESLCEGSLISTNLSPKSCGEPCGMIRLSAAVLTEFVVTKSPTPNSTECTRSSQEMWWMWYYIYIQPKDLPFLHFLFSSPLLPPHPPAAGPQIEPHCSRLVFLLSVPSCLSDESSPFFSYPARHPLRLSTNTNHTLTLSTHQPSQV